jgi:glutathione S-transferase
MITLYVKTGCPFSAKAMAALDAYEVPYETKNIKSPDWLRELMELGGKKQTPFMVDGETMFYESDAIVEYVEKNFGGGVKKKKPRIHTSNAGMCG